MNTMKLFYALSYIAIPVFTCVACVDIEGPVVEPLGPSNILSRVTLNTSAVMMAEGDSHKVQLTMYAMNGESIPYDPDSVRWSSSESKIVKISSDGTIHGLKVSDGAIQVTATYRHKYVTRSDTINVYVTNETIDADAVKLIAIDSNRSDNFAVYGAPRVRVDLYRGNTLVQKGSIVPIEIDLPAKATMNPIGGPSREPVYLISPGPMIGKFWIRTSVNLYGNPVNDSIEFIGLYSSLLSYMVVDPLPADQLSQPTVLDTLPLRLYQPCAFVQIRNGFNDTLDFVFSDSAVSSSSCAEAPPHRWLTDFINVIFNTVQGQFIGGNVTSMPPNSIATRQSNTEGVITWYIRNSRTKEPLPFYRGHYKQLNVE